MITVTERYMTKLVRLAEDASEGNEKGIGFLLGYILAIKDLENRATDVREKIEARGRPRKR